MEEATHQTHRHHLLEVKVNPLYMVLGIILIMPILWQVIGNDRIGKWHPFFNVEYSLYWYIALTMYNLKPMMYLIVAGLVKKKHFRLIKVFIIYELILFFDHMLIYSQSPGIKIGGIALAFYMVYYHYRYG